MIDTSMYTVVRGDALLRAKGKEPRGIMNDGTPIKRVTGLSMPRAIPAHKQQSLSAWMESATAQGKDAEARPLLGKVYQQGEYVTSADGYRCHAALGVVTSAVAWEGSGAPDFLSLFPRQCAYRARVSSSALWRALHATKPFSRDASNIVRFECDPDALIVSATSAEWGDVSVRIEGDEYSLHGEPFAFALNNEYALDAVRGMGAQCELSTRKATGETPITFESGERRALVMPMDIGYYIGY